MSLIPVIMAGGSGSRLWPQSRSLYPKQFLPLINNTTMLQDTVLRLDGINALQPAIVVANEEHRFLVAEQLREIGRPAASIILEPVGRNTAPALALAALQSLIGKPDDEDVMLLVLAADHVIKDIPEFHNAVNMALKYARNGKLVTFGIVPTKPETGYGYIKAGYTNAGEVIPIEKFVEKPELKVAQKYVEQGGYYWNSGMFLFSARKYLKELGFYREDILEACQLAISTENIDLNFTRINEKAFIQCPDESIDYAVMEKTTEAVVVPLDAGWSDVGSWSALWDISEKDSHGNATTGDVQVFDTYDTYVRSEKKFIATVGVKDLVISESDDAILIAHKSRVQDVKHIVSDLKIRNRSEANLHRQVYRPWGRYDSIDNGERFQVKRITVKPGEKLSLQKHYHRAEHWIVVHGSALVTKGDKELLLTENQSTYIPVGEIHRLENPGKVDLELIEVQSGSYLGEDDIVRFTDIYGRVS